MLTGYFSKIKFIFSEEGVVNLIRRIFRYIAYLTKRYFYRNDEDYGKWELLKNNFKGKRVFLIGNGPSLNKTPLHFLKNEITLCINRFNLMFDRLNWRPHMYAISDDVVILDMLSELDEIKNNVKYLFLPDIHPSTPITINYKKLINNSENIYWFYPDKIGFSTNLPSIGLNKTVTNVAIQILVFLGFNEIYLVGVDLDYKMHESAKNLDNRHLESRVDDDPNHFDPRYFGSGRKYHIPRMEETLEKFKKAKDFCDKYGVEIYNATVGGKLEVFPRVDFTSLFNFSKKEQLNLLMETIEIKNDGFEKLSDAFPKARKINCEDEWDNSWDEIIVSSEIGYKLIPKKIISYLPLGPFNNNYLFIKRKYKFCTSLNL